MLQTPQSEGTPEPVWMLQRFRDEMFSNAIIGITDSSHLLCPPQAWEALLEPLEDAIHNVESCGFVLGCEQVIGFA
ncbi:Uncharacterised protein [uncultured archaeon]|nr:Uncharacterised protein [uncultured archaeon]